MNIHQKQIAPLLKSGRRLTLRASRGRIDWEQLDESDGFAEFTAASYDYFRNHLADSKRTAKAGRDKFAELMAIADVDVNALEEATAAATAKSLPRRFGIEFLRQVEASFGSVWRLPVTIKQLIEKMGLRTLQALVREQDSHLLQAVTQPSDPYIEENGHVLVAFSVVEDLTTTLTQCELDRLIAAVIDYEKKKDPEATRDSICHEASRRAQVGLNANGGKLDDQVCDATDILAHVIVLMDRGGLKPAVTDSDLQKFIVDFFDAGSAAEKSYGGAAGNEADILRALGLPVLLYVPYHDQRQADLAPQCAKRLAFGTKGLVRPYPSAGEGGKDEEACRFSFVFQLTPQLDDDGKPVGPVFEVGDDPCKPKRADRVILRFPQPRTANPARWDKLKLTWKGEGKPEWESADANVKYDGRGAYWYVEVDRSALTDKDGKALFGDNDLPYLPIFQHTPRISRETLVVELASRAEMEQVAEDVQVALLGGIQAIAKEKLLTEEITELLRHVLPAQLSALGSKGASLHFELSGVDSEKVVGELKRLLERSGVKNLSLNREELAQITSEFGSDYFVFPRSSVPDSPMSVLCRAVELLKRLNMDTVYVHDLELDVLFCRNSSEVEIGDREIVEQVENRLAHHRQAMLLAKAAVPAHLLRRARIDAPWDLVLSTESLVALAGFACDYAAYVEPTDQTEQSRIVQELLCKGFHYPGVDGFSVVVAPGVEFPAAVSLSGAGDMGFAVRAAAQ